jgi:hypothetical protein
MGNIILQLIKKYINFEKNMNFVNMISMIQNNSHLFFGELMTAVLEHIDVEIMLSLERKRSWRVIKITKRTIRTIVGTVTFKRRYYQNKHTGQYAYLLDQAIGILPYQRLGVLLESKLLDFTNTLSYEKAGEMVIDFDTICKQTVKNIVSKFAAKENEFFKDKDDKKIVKSLYIEADEDHVSLQKSLKNNVINKLIYVHEGKSTESKGRKFLLNKKIFASNLKSPEDMWIEVYDYIYSTYDTTKIENIFILGDGASWIKTGLEWIENSEYVLDSFHLNKAILQISGGQKKEGTKVTYEKLKGLIYSKNKKSFKTLAKEIVDKETGFTAKTRKENHMKYILNQWSGIESNLDNKAKHQLGCSAEGHVSHILSARMSSRPLSWSREGLEAITKLRISILNGITRTGIEKTLLKVNKKISQEKYKPVKHLKRIKRHAMETLGNVPVLSIGKVNGLQTMMNGLK